MTPVALSACRMPTLALELWKVIIVPKKIVNIVL